MVLKNEGLDATDWKILALLQDDARITYREIGDAVGLPRPAARERVQRMEERGVIRSWRAGLDAEAVGRALHVMITFKFSPDADYGDKTPNAALAPLLEERREVVRFWELYGELDFLIEAAFRSKEEMRGFLEELRVYGFVRAHLIAAAEERGIRPLSDAARRAKFGYGKGPAQRRAFPLR